eukprot:Hpha_TRINITY_DN10874_c0_g1::TRINITY_DN10874_c0_g1_i1::g.23476::m.23476
MEHAVAFLARGCAAEVVGIGGPLLAAAASRPVSPAVGYRRRGGVLAHRQLSRPPRLPPPLSFRGGLTAQRRYNASFAPGKDREQAIEDEQRRRRARDLERKERTEMTEEGILGGDTVGDISGKTWKDFIYSAKLRVLSPRDLFQTKDISEVLQSTGDDILMQFLLQRLSKSPEVLDDEWCAAFLREYGKKVRESEISTMPSAKVLVKALQVMSTNKNFFQINAQSYNVLLRALYDDNFATDQIIQFYGQYREYGIKPNAVTFGLMFSTCLKARKKEAADGFYNACKQVLTADKVSFRSKTDIIQNIALGIRDTRSHEYAISVIQLLHEEWKKADLPTALPPVASDRKKGHLYITPRVIHQLFWACANIGNGKLVDTLTQWMRSTHDKIQDFPKASYGHLLKTCGHSEDLTKAFEVFNLIIEKGITSENINETHIQSVVACLQKQRTDPAKVREQLMGMLEHMEKIGALRDDSEVTKVTLISVYAGANDYASAMEIFNDIKKTGFKTDRALRALCTGRHARANVDKVKEAFDVMREYKRANKSFILDQRTVNRYFGVLADLGMFDELNDCIEDMSIHDGFKKDLQTYHRVLTACSRDKAASSFGTFYKLRESGHEDYPMYFSHLKDKKTTSKNCEVAQNIFHKLQREGLKPDAQTYNLLMSVYAQAGLQDQVFTLYKEMKDNGLQEDSHTYVHMVNVCSENGDVNQVGRVLNELLDKNLPFNGMFCSLLLKSLANCGDSIKTLAYLRSMSAEEVDYASHDQTSKTIIQKQPTITEVECGMKLVKMLQDSGLKADVQVLTQLMNLCLRAGEWQKAEDVYNQIQKAGLSIRDRSDIVTQIMKTFHYKGDVDMCVGILRESVQAGVSLQATAYLNALSVCALKGDVKRAMEVINLMLGKGEVVGDMAIAQVVLACARHNGDGSKVEEAREVIAEFTRQHQDDPTLVPMVATQHVYHTLLYVAQEEGEPDKIEDILKEMKEADVLVDRVSIGYYPKALRVTADVAKLDNVWTLLDTYGVTEVDTVLLYQMERVCLEAVDARKAVQILEFAKTRAAPGMKWQALAMFAHKIMDRAQDMDSREKALLLDKLRVSLGLDRRVTELQSAAESTPRASIEEQQRMARAFTAQA